MWIICQTIESTGNEMDGSYQVPQIDMTLSYPSDPENFLDCALFIPTSQFLMADEILLFKSSIPS